MKNLAGLLGGIILGVGLLFTPVKSYSQEFYGHGGVAIEATMEGAPITPEYWWQGIDSGALITLGAEARFGLGWNLKDILDLKIGGQFDFSLNGDLTGGSEGYFELISKTPKVSPNLGAFARASFFNKHLFLEYSVDFINQCSLLTGERSFEVETGYPGTVDIDEHRDIYSTDLLATYLNQKLVVGIHANFERKSFDLYGGLCFPKIIEKTSLCDELGMIETGPTITLGGRFGIGGD